MQVAYAVFTETPVCISFDYRVETTHIILELSSSHAGSTGIPFQVCVYEKYPHPLLTTDKILFQHKFNARIVLEGSFPTGCFVTVTSAAATSGKIFFNTPNLVWSKKRGRS